MRALLLIAGLLAFAWTALTLAIVYVEVREHRRHDHNLATRDWQEKVAAMRRMHDQEGEA